MSNTKKIISKDKLAEKFRFFFKKFSWKKTLTFLFFLLLSVIFWGMQVYSQKIEIKIAIPIKYTNIANNILFENELPNEIDVQVKDQGGTIFKYLMHSKDSLEIDMGALIKESQSRRTLQGQAYEQMIRTKLLPGSELLSFYPASISYAFNKVSVKKIPVLYDGFTNIPPGYQLDGDISISPDSVFAYGSSATLDTVTFAYTSTDTLENIKENQSIEVAINETRGVKYKPNTITVEIPVDRFMEKKLQVPVTCINLPDNLKIKFFPSDITVTFLVGLKRANLIESGDFKIIIDYKDIEYLQDASVPIRIIESPDFVRTKLPEPSEVEFILEQE